MANILILDDEREVRDINKRVLEAEGHTCVTASTLEQAHLALDVQPFDMVLLDILLPEGSGLDLLESIRTQYRDTGVVMITAVDDPEVAKLALKKAVQGYLTKPFRAEDLIITVTNALRLRELELKEKRFRQELEAMVAKRTESLRASESRYRKLVDTMTEGLAVTDIGDRLVYVNNQICNALKLPREEILGRQIIDFIDPEYLESYKEATVNRFKGEKPVYEMAWRNREGKIIYTLVSPSVLFDDQGRPEGTFAVVTNITKQKATENELKRSFSMKSVINDLLTISMGEGSLEEVLGRALEAIFSVPWLSFEDKGAIFLVDEAEGKQLVMTAQHGVAKWVVESCARVDFGECLCGLAAQSRAMVFVDRSDERHKAQPQGGPDHGHYCLPIQHGDKLVGVLNCYVQAGHKQDDLEVEFLQSVASILAEVIERKRAEGALRTSEEKFRKVVENANEAIFVIQEDGYRFVNDFGVRLFKTSREEILSSPPARFIHPDEREKVLDRITRRLAGKVIDHPVEHRIIDAEGEVKWTEVRVVLTTWEGSPATIAFVVDVTDRKTAEEALKSSEAKYRELVENANSIILRLDNEGRITFFNEFAQKFFGWPAAEIIGRPAVGTIVPETESTGRDLTLMIKEIVEPDNGRTYNENENIKRNGERVWVAWANKAVADEDGRMTGLLCVGTDITERKELERQLLQAQKLESIGQLAAGIAHEINTPIQYVGDNTRFLRDAFEDLIQVLGSCGRLSQEVREGRSTTETAKEVEEAIREADLDYLSEEIPKAIDQTLEGVGRVASIVRAMKEFSHPGTENKTPVDINQAIQSTVTVTRNEWKYVAEMELELDPSLPLVPVLPGEFNQVILNMIINSAQAIGEVVGEGSEEKGRITISTSLKNKELEVRVSDTGCGIPGAIRDRVFDPFFTTKEVGQGTGQGLAIARSVIVDKHAGSLRLESEEGRGTTFRILLPISDDDQEGESH